MNTKGLTIGLIALLVLGVGGAALVMQGEDDNKTETSNTSMNHESGNNESTTNESEGASQAVATTSVEIRDSNYSPSTIRVKVGDTVTWTNQDDIQHNVVADEPSSDAPDGPLLSKGESYKFTFNKAGTYAYHCQPHPFMKATVIVE